MQPWFARDTVSSVQTQDGAYTPDQAQTQILTEPVKRDCLQESRVSSQGRQTQDVKQGDEGGEGELCVVVVFSRTGITEIGVLQYSTVES